MWRWEALVVLMKTKSEHIVVYIQRFNASHYHCRHR